MDLTSDGVAQTVLPTAAFPRPDHNEFLEIRDYSNQDSQWVNSALNPKNRIDSLSPVSNPKWRIDGCAGMATQFYTIPLFVRPTVPMRIDTFIPEASKIQVALREALEVNTAIYLRDGRVARLGISRYIVRVLEYWSNEYEDFEAFYKGLPFGSRIVIENITANLKQTRVQVVKTHYLEKQLLSWEALGEMWKLPSLTSLTLVDITEVHLVRQLHDSVSLVVLGNQNYILKALTSYPKYLYHELRDLLSLPPHPSIISRPIHIITKQCKFGSKIAVVGFTLQYHQNGTLRDELPFRRIHNTLVAEDQFRWATQLTEALIHIRDAGKFYCDLRLDNVVLDANDNLVMIDFEARGVALSASAPEINYLEYIYNLATEKYDDAYPPKARERFVQLYEKMIDGRGIMRPSERYKNPPHGYSVPWLCLDEKERETAGIYMLGRVLWCIFEGVGAPEKTAMVSHVREDELEFPQWVRTPREIRNLIERCTSFVGTEHRALPVVRRGDQIRLRNGERNGDPGEVKEVARRWWQLELDCAEAFLNERLTTTESLDFGRPRLDDVLLELRSLQILYSH